jgi:hypothetical protein
MERRFLDARRPSVLETSLVVAKGKRFRGQTPPRQDQKPLCKFPETLGQLKKQLGKLADSVG